MTMELLSTSVPAGLEPGSSGYCIVAMTQGIPRPLVQQLETLSAYRPLFLPGDPRAHQNPVNVAYLRVSVGGKSYAVFSRVSFAGADYTGRSNRFAHHVVLDGSESRPVGGPGWTATRPGFLQMMWDNQVRWIPAGRRVPTGSDIPIACPSWNQVTGDSGWAGILAGAMLQDTGKPFYLIYDPGMNAVDLIAEALSVVPAEQRWTVTFATYYTGIPPGVTCHIRAVVRGSQEAQGLPAGSYLDLANIRHKSPPPSEWVEAARTGKRQAKVPHRAVDAVGVIPTAAQVMSKSPVLHPVNGPVLQEVPPPPPDEFELEYADDATPKKERSGSSVGWMVLASTVFVLLLGGGSVVAWKTGLFNRNHEGHVAPGQGNGENPGPGSGNQQGQKGTVDSLTLKFEPLVRVDDPLKVTVEVKTSEGAPVFAFANLQFFDDGKRIEPVVIKGNSLEFNGIVKAGKHTIEARFPGDEKFQPIDPVVQTLEVHRRKITGFALELESNKTRVGDSLPFTLAGSEMMEIEKHATIQIREKQKTQWNPVEVMTDVEEELQAILAPAKAGDYLVRAQIKQTDRVEEAVTKEVPVTVSRIPAKLLLSRIDVVKFSEGTLDLKAVVMPVNRLPAPKGTMVLSLEGPTKVELKAYLNKNQFKKEELKAGQYKGVLQFQPDESDQTYSTTSVDLSGQSLVVIPRKRYQINLTEVDPNNPGEVRFKVPRPSEESRFPELSKTDAYYLQFQPSSKKIEGKLEATQKAGTTTQMLTIDWIRPKEKGEPEVKGKQLFIFAITEPTLQNPVPFAKHSLSHATTLLGVRPADIPGFRKAAESLHGSVIEIYAATKNQSQRIKKGNLPVLRLVLDAGK